MQRGRRSLQKAGAHGGAAGVGVRTAEGQRAGALFDEAPGLAEDAGEGGAGGVADGQGAGAEQGGPGAGQRADGG
ncbi:MAG: hypothetical protein MRJ96_08570 [Nitrospirales bacterium]|nr:hypothetical protein [Nitrospirales bacterium]